VERNEMDDDDWVKRYDLEEELIRAYNHEEVYWQSRGDVKWILEGDSNTTYFNSLANGRRKCRIDYLDTENGRITEQQALMDHIYEFYKKLFGEEERGTVRLAVDMWQDKGRLSLVQQVDLIKPFSVGEVEQALKDMKTDMAPSPDGFPVVFYKKFWGLVVDYVNDGGFSLGGGLT
jgi:hypothetical protein